MCKKKKKGRAAGWFTRLRLVRKMGGRFVYYDVIGDARNKKPLQILIPARIDSVSPSGKVEITLQNMNGGDGPKKQVKAETLIPKKKK